MTISSRGDHPDFDEYGNLKPDVQLGSTEDVDFNRRLRDPTSAQHFFSQVARMQNELPSEIQLAVQGRTYAPQGSAAEGYRAYQDAIAWQKELFASQRGYSRFVMDSDLPNMSDAEYAEAFDEQGQPRPDTYFHRTSRSIVLDDRTNIRGPR